MVSYLSAQTATWSPHTPSLRASRATVPRLTAGQAALVSVWGAFPAASLLGGVESQPTSRLPWRMQCNAAQCNARQCNAKQNEAMQCNAMQCSAIQCVAMQCGPARLWLPGFVVLGLQARAQLLLPRAPPPVLPTAPFAYTRLGYPFWRSCLGPWRGAHVGTMIPFSVRKVESVK